jgi:hypothetical protein
VRVRIRHPRRARVRGRRRGRPRRALVVAAGERERDRNLLHGILGQRDADRVADAVLEQRADSDRALHPAVDAVARLGDADVERVGRPAGRARLEPRGEQPIGLDRDLRVARLHAEDDVEEALVLADVEELERALHHAERRVAEAVQDAVGERAVVRADAQRAAELLQAADERPEPLLHAIDLRGVLRVAVLALLEALLVGVVARVDPHLLDVAGRLERRVRREVDVRDQRRRHAAPRELGPDRRQVLRVRDGRRRHAQDLAAGGDEPLALRDGGGGVARIGGRHRLDADRVRAADADRSDLHLARRPAPPGERAGRRDRAHAAAPAARSA